MTQRIWKSVGPIVLSALSLFISSIILQPIAFFLDPSFSLMANRGVGKIALTVLVILHIILLISFQPTKFLHSWLETNLTFFKSKNWLLDFSHFFALGSLLHILALILFVTLGATVLDTTLIPTLNSSIAFKVLLGFIATFFLAYTEELIFRGTLYPFFAQNMLPLTSVVLTSFIFVVAHAISGTLTTKLFIGLFLLGMFLNLIFVISGKLYLGMGFHAGLVFIKVFLRRIPLITQKVFDCEPWWFAQDLRQSSLIHIFFIIIIIVLCLRYRPKLIIKTSDRDVIKPPETSERNP
ncbi:MAG: type II CAAX endopeptidase family protein [bacterium]